MGESATIPAGPKREPRAADRANMTLTQVRGLPAAIDVAIAARALGNSRSAAYEAIRTGTFPVKTIRVGHRIRVLTADLIRVLEGNDDARAS